MTANVSRVKVARVGKGYTQWDLAQAVGVVEVTISRIETGRLTPTPELKTKIAAVLGKPAFELFNA